MTADLDSVGVICPECGNPESIFLAARGGVWWFQCRACGAEYTLQAQAAGDEDPEEAGDDERDD